MTVNAQRDSDLIRAVLDHECPTAYSLLVKRYERLVWTVAWQILRDYHATQDVTQETFLIAHKNLADLHKPEYLGSWLSTIARREAQRVGNQRKNVEFSPLEDIAGRDSARSPNEDIQPLLVAISGLPDHERDVIALRYFNGHSIAEVAHQLDRPIGTVTKQLSRAVKRLQSRCADEQSSLNTANE